MVCQQLDQLEWDFIQARAGSREIDSLGWTEREYSCLDAMAGSQAGGASRRTLPSGLSTMPLDVAFVEHASGELIPIKNHSHAVELFIREDGHFSPQPSTD
jgi:hypothetical protein